MLASAEWYEFESTLKKLLDGLSSAVANIKFDDFQPQISKRKDGYQTLGYMSVHVDEGGHTRIYIEEGTVHYRISILSAPKDDISNCSHVVIAPKEGLDNICHWEVNEHVVPSRSSLHSTLAKIKKFPDVHERKTRAVIAVFWEPIGHLLENDVESRVSALFASPAVPPKPKVRPNIDPNSPK